ncbi:EDD domain protein, DegV family [Pilibacter termitis]|uniref:EDD domain protein, DegV family n=1 Tax=Pilibacter termitis TaxID=263852 RepID=A0A1T4NZ97_9ENTE|nr:DegV family protein [Pilibacter termitis]SJZ84432.1 EDD domain protein, DegV family [Pilibacter termitis]
MTKIKIVTDSSAIFEEGVAEKLGIEIVPLSVMIDGVIYQDDELAGEKFVELMRQAETLPKTSQPAIGLFAEAYDKYADCEIISIHLTKHLSGTFEAARQASNLTQANVTVLDSGFIDQALAFQAIKAAEMAQAGANKEEILEKLEKMKKNTKLFVAIATLDNIVKSGRISKTAGMISNLLNIKAVMELTVDEGLVMVTKGRGNKTFHKWFENIRETLLTTPNLEKIAISHAGAAALLEPFKKELNTLFPDIHLPFLYTGSVIATHAGEGAFAIEYYTDED